VGFCSKLARGRKFRHCLGTIGLIVAPWKISATLSSVAAFFFFYYRQNEGGRSVKLKCFSVKEAEDWREALEAESAVPVDSSPVPGESPVTEVLVHLLSLTPRVPSSFTDCSILSFRLSLVC